jgi:hypothetical protein
LLKLTERKEMDLQAEVAAVAADPERSRQPLYRLLLAATVHVREPVDRYALTQPDTGVRAVPAFATAAEAESFWAQAVPGRPVQGIAAVSFIALAAAARPVGGVVLDPAGDGVLLDRAELAQLAVGEIPGEFAAWLREMGRLARTATDTLGRLRRAQVHVITGKGQGDEQRLYLLEKSEDATMAVPCFSDAASLAQFAQVRGLFEGHHDYAIALVSGEHCLRVAAGLGAYVLVDPESPWETQLEPSLL